VVAGLLQGVREVVASAGTRNLLSRGASQASITVHGVGMLGPGLRYLFAGVIGACGES
jgi:hypothetical protein